MKMKLLANFAAGLGTVLQLQAQGYIVPNGVTSVDLGGVNEIVVVQNPNPLNITGFIMLPAGGDLFSFSSVLDEGVRVFFASANDPFGLSQIQSQTYHELLPSVTYSLQDGMPFYVGLYTGASISPPFPQTPPIFYTDPVFGWAQLVNNSGRVYLLNGALAANAPGIYVGTTTIIPEPSVFGLFGLGALLLGWQMRRKCSLCNR